MFLPPSSSLLAALLDGVARRYRLPALAGSSESTQPASPATMLALAIEQACEAKSRGEAPDAANAQHFTDALAQVIREALRHKAGDPAFQALLMRHRSDVVREYASLSAQASHDRRQIHATVNTIAHPAKQERLGAGPQRDALARLHASAFADAWAQLDTAVQACLDTTAITHDATLRRGLAQLRDSAELQRLQRLHTLASDQRVRDYQSLCERQGPRPGSASAIARGASSKQRGAEVEALASESLERLAQRLNEVEREVKRAGRADDPYVSYRVVNSMRVPATIPASHERAKTEWDVVLLRQTRRQPSTSADSAAWDLCLLIEAKASVDAATTDLPRLLRGLTLLAQADPTLVYEFRTEQGTVRVNGASLAALQTDAVALARTVLYCCDASADATPRVLSPASRMQLLSAPASLEFASALADGHNPACTELEPVWRELIEAPRWRAVLGQYSTLRQVRELMVHTLDLREAVDNLDNLGNGHG
ncbi:3-deoxy-D-arabino-heptulosonate 7-phosphate synthase [Paraburkholderia antibiotica]|uniref:3-deoxy-D-arabino-heptulosonate 7-phosphate synthase n=1 Tax=Paraburkholderia antibiotica TaxID=2728839 RepID=A0A7X9X7B8_9BURK|nr:3-deoxy-D-arabino-heptulosonate 7-phosphate synthase [Paraburkholderia antibiotica]NML32292.1 3-deoxy-D-arabino-heptulosonate 7-phosphate synthase [Paraburkholderia antibiotica]